MNLADRDSVILVYPESKNAEWHCDLRMPDNRVDYEFVLALVKELRKEHSATSFFASGLSSGGDISSCLACEVDNPFEGFGVVAYAYYW
eukprot:gene3273-2530_t